MNANAKRDAKNALYRLMIAKIIETDVAPESAPPVDQYLEYCQYMRYQEFAHNNAWFWLGWSPNEIIFWNRKDYSDLHFMEPIWDWILENFTIPDDANDEDFEALTAWEMELLDTPLYKFPYSMLNALIERFDWEPDWEESLPPVLPSKPIDPVYCSIGVKVDGGVKVMEFRA